MMLMIDDEEEKWRLLKPCYCKSLGGWKAEALFGWRAADLQPDKFSVLCCRYLVPCKMPCENDYTRW
jgi:hypothetical protein